MAVELTFHKDPRLEGKGFPLVLRKQRERGMCSRRDPSRPETGTGGSFLRPRYRSGLFVTKTGVKNWMTGRGMFTKLGGGLCRRLMSNFMLPRLKPELT